MNKDGLREYVISRTALDHWDTGQGNDIPATTRARSVFWTAYYGIFGNPMFWAGAVCFATIMMGATGYGLIYNLLYYVRATLISYVWADMLPLKSFSSDGDGPMDPVKAATTNSLRMFAPLLISGIAIGKFAPGYTLFGLVAVAAVEAGKHALFHANDGMMFADWTMLTDLLERRLAVIGLSLPPNVAVIEGFVTRDNHRGMEIEQELVGTPGEQQTPQDPADPW